MSHCTNINHPQIQEWSKRLKVTPETIGAIVSIWQEQNNNLEELPSFSYMFKQVVSSKSKIVNDELEESFSFDTKDTSLTNNEWMKSSNEENKLISQQFEHIEASKSQKQTCEKIMSFQNDLGGTTDKNYILKNNTVLNRTSSVIDKDPKFKFENEDFDEEEYDINRQWGNQIDDVLRAVILYRFDKDQEAKVLEGIH